MFYVNSESLVPPQLNEKLGVSQVAWVNVEGIAPFYIIELEAQSMYQTLTTRAMTDDIVGVLIEKKSKSTRVAQIDMVLRVGSDYRVRRVKDVWQNPNCDAPLIVFDDGAVFGAESVTTELANRGFSRITDR
jgi:hypothetical protein